MATNSDIYNLKNLPFAASHRAKQTTPPFDGAWYRVKDVAILESLKMGTAYANYFDFSSGEPMISVTFVSGGDLHIPPTSLDAETWQIVAPQLIARIRRARKE